MPHPWTAGNAGYGILLDGYACQVECEVDYFLGKLNRFSGLYIDNEQVSDEPTSVCGRVLGLVLMVIIHDALHLNILTT